MKDSWKRKIWAWGQIVRLPNLLTVPGDVIMGHLCAGGEWGEGVLIPLIAIVLCHYVGGVILNDVADYNQDCQERPHRPLPQGIISRLWAGIVGLGLLLLGTIIGNQVNPIIATFSMVLCGLILLYNFGRKWLGRWSIGAMVGCRLISFMLGLATQKEWVYLWWGWGLGCLFILYMTGVCWIAWDEIKKSSSTWLIGKLCLCFSWLGSFLLILWLGSGWGRVVAFSFFALQIVGWMVAQYILKYSIPQLVGILLGNLILWQGAWIAVFSSPHLLVWIAITVLVIRFLLFERLRKVFKPS